MAIISNEVCIHLLTFYICTHTQIYAHMYACMNILICTHVSMHAHIPACLPEPAHRNTCPPKHPSTKTLDSPPLAPCPSCPPWKHLTHPGPLPILSTHGDTSIVNSSRMLRNENIDNFR